MAFMDDLVSAIARTPSMSPGPPPSTQPRTRVTTLGDKRTATEAGLTDDDDSISESSPSPPSMTQIPNLNLTLTVKHLGGQKKLKLEHQRELEEFARDTLTMHNIKMFAKMLTLESKIDKIVTSPLPFQVSKALSTNILSYSTAVFFSSKLAAYKGHVPRNHVLDILKRLRFDMPPGIENNLADWGKVKSAVQETLTQIRGAVKKLLKKSIVNRIDTRQNIPIYDLAQKIVAHTECKVTIPLMARVALMRAVYMEFAGENFWDQVDQHLATLRLHADTPEKLVGAFKHTLNKDRETHGPVHEYEEAVDDIVVDDIQQSVDDAIEEANSIQVVDSQSASYIASPAGSTSSEGGGRGGDASENE